MGRRRKLDVDSVIPTYNVQELFSGLGKSSALSLSVSLALSMSLSVFLSLRFLFPTSSLKFLAGMKCLFI